MKRVWLPVVLFLWIALAAPVLAGGIEIGPRGGRILQLKSLFTPRIEVLAKDGKFVIYVVWGDYSRQPRHEHRQHRRKGRMTNSGTLF